MRLSGLTGSMEALISQIVKLPGIGQRTAERLAFYILQRPKGEVQDLADALIDVKDTIGFCERCNNLSDDKLCIICNDSRRDQTLLCVVEHPKDVIAVEKAGGFHGLYHVLLGALSPLEGIGPNDLKVKALLERIKTGEFQEVILGTDSDTEGETTALYLMQQMKPLEVKVTRLAQGLPMGSHMEYADQVTLTRAFEGRREV